MPAAISMDSTLPVKPIFSRSKLCLTRFASTSYVAVAANGDTNTVPAILHGPGMYRAPQKKKHKSYESRSPLLSPNWMRSSQNVQTPRGIKRKGTNHSQLPPARRRKEDTTSATSQNRERNVPSPAEYPYLPPKVFQDPKSHLHEIYRGFGAFSSEIHSSNRSIFVCSLKFKFTKENMPMTAEGQGRNKVGNMEAE